MYYVFDVCDVQYIRSLYCMCMCVHASGECLWYEDFGIACYMLGEYVVDVVCVCNKYAVCGEHMQ